MNPTLALGLLWHVEPNSKPRFLSSCFMLRWGSFFVAPSHGVRALNPSQIRVSSATLPMTEPEEITHHGVADICVLRLPQFDYEPGDCFWGIADEYEPGEAFHALGWPDDCLPGIVAARGVPLPESDPPWAKVRLLSGTYQRFIPQHLSAHGLMSLVGELSVPCPLGLSGGPLFRPQTPPIVAGMVIGNLQTQSEPHSRAYVEKDGTVRGEQHNRVLEYGVALMLDHVANWLDEHIPPRDGAAS